MSLNMKIYPPAYYWFNPGIQEIGLTFLKMFNGTQCINTDKHEYAKISTDLQTPNTLTVVCAEPEI